MPGAEETNTPAPADMASQLPELLAALGEFRALQSEFTFATEGLANVAGRQTLRHSREEIILRTETAMAKRRALKVKFTCQNLRYVVLVSRELYPCSGV